MPIATSISMASKILSSNKHRKLLKRANKADTQTSSKNKGIIHFPPIVIISTNVQLNGIAMLAYDIILQSAYRNREEATILNSDCRTTRKTIPHYVSRDTRKRALTM